MEEEIPKGENKKIQVVLISILVIISGGAVIGYTLSSDPEIKENEPTGPFLATFYTALSPEESKNLMETNVTPLLILDIRDCKCNYNTGHLPNATWNVNPYSFWNKTEDLLIYSNDNNVSIFFCERLINNTYSRLFYLDGGYDAWEKAGYPIEK